MADNARPSVWANSVKRNSKPRFNDTRWRPASIVRHRPQVVRLSWLIRRPVELSFSAVLWPRNKWCRSDWASSHGFSPWFESPASWIDTIRADDRRQTTKCSRNLNFRYFNSVLQIQISHFEFAKQTHTVRRWVLLASKWLLKGGDIIGMTDLAKPSWTKAKIGDENAQLSCVFPRRLRWP